MKAKRAIYVLIFTSLFGAPIGVEASANTDATYVTCWARCGLTDSGGDVVMAAAGLEDQARTNLGTLCGVDGRRIQGGVECTESNLRPIAEGQARCESGAGLSQGSCECLHDFRIRVQGKPRFLFEDRIGGLPSVLFWSTSGSSFAEARAKAEAKCNDLEQLTGEKIEEKICQEMTCAYRL